MIMGIPLYIIGKIYLRPPFKQKLIIVGMLYILLLIMYQGNDIDIFMSLYSIIYTKNIC